MTTFAPVFRMLLLAGGLVFASAAVAQHGGGHGGGSIRSGGGSPESGFPGSGGMSGSRSSGFPTGFGGNAGGIRSNGGGPPPGSAPDSAGTVSTLRGGLQLGPPGRWWDDKHFAKDLKLRPDQQRHMDAAFEENRSNLLKHYETLQGEEARLEVLTRAKSLDQTALYAQIDRVAQARAELEKANTHLLLQLRSEMDADQVLRLEQHR